MPAKKTRLNKLEIVLTGRIRSESRYGHPQEVLWTATISGWPDSLKGSGLTQDEALLKLFKNNIKIFNVSNIKTKYPKDYEHYSDSAIFA